MVTRHSGTLPSAPAASGLACERKAVQELAVLLNRLPDVRSGEELEELLRRLRRGIAHLARTDREACLDLLWSWMVSNTAAILGRFVSDLFREPAPPLSGLTLPAAEGSCELLPSRLEAVLQWQSHLADLLRQRACIERQTALARKHQQATKRPPTG